MGIKWWVGIILFLAVISFYKLGSIPRGFDGDEAAIGYYAYSLFKTGVDEFGRKWPIYFKSIGDYKYPGYSYLSMLPVAVMGLSIFSARFLSAVAGVVMVLLLIKTLAAEKLLPKNKWWIVLGVVAVAASPWYLVFARAAREAMLGLALVTGGFYLVWRNKWWGVLLFVAAGLTYPAYRLFGAGLLLGLIFLQDTKISRRSFMFFGMAMILILLNLDSLSRIRAGGLLFTTDQAVKDQAQSQIWEVGRVWPGLPGVAVARIFDNKVIVWGWDWLRRYVSHFDWSYLFFNGNQALIGYAVPKTGLLLLATAPLIIFGLIELVKNWKKSQFSPLVAWWLLWAPISSSLAVESPNPIRHLASLPAYAWLIFLGVRWLDERIKGKWLALIAILVAINGAYGWKQYSIHREFRKPWHLGQGTKEMVEFVMENYDKYPAVAVSNDPYIFFLFFNPERWGAKNLTILDRQWDSVSQLENIHFLMPYNCPKVGKVEVLYICKGGEVPQNSKVLFVVRSNDGEVAYSAIELMPLSQTARPLPELPERLHYMVEADGRNDGVIPPEEERIW